MNAVEAMSEAGKGSRDLLISTVEDKSNGVLVAVRDSGPSFHFSLPVHRVTAS